MGLLRKEVITPEQQKARDLLHEIFLWQPRAAGRTHQMLEGLRNADKRVVCLVHSSRFAAEVARQINNKNVTFITTDALSAIRGTRCPLVADHVVVEQLIREAF